jgi:large subunit ribosomal protein L27
MAHKKGVGSSKNGRENQNQNVYVKILVVKLLLLGTSSRQRGSKHNPGAMFTSVKITHHTQEMELFFQKKKRDNNYVSIPI